MFIGTLFIYLGPSERTVSRAIRQVTYAIIGKLQGLISWSNDEASNRKIAEGFFRMAGMPMVAGCVDGTVVPIKPPRDTGGTFKGKDNIKGIKVLFVIIPKIF